MKQQKLLLTLVLDIFQRFLECFMTSLTSKQLAASEVPSDFLTVLVFVTNQRKQLKLCFSLSGAKQLFHLLQCCRFVFRFCYIVK